MFRNRWAALLFVAMTLAGVTKLVGTESDRGSLDEATRQIAQQREIAEQMTTDTVTAPDVEVIEALPSDEDLIDPATGYDPTPPDPFATESEAPEEASQTVMLVDSSDILTAPDATSAE